MAQCEDEDSAFVVSFAEAKEFVMASAQAATAHPLVKTETIAGETPVMQELDAHDFPLDMQVSAIEYALAEANQVTEDDPGQFEAQVIYAKATRGLRETGRLYDWYRASENGFETTVHWSGARAIVVANGSAGTGDPDGQPSTRAPKGRMTTRAINVAQGSFWGMPRPIFSKEPEQPRDGEQQMETWFLLVRIGPNDRCAYAELSLPLAPIPSVLPKGGIQISAWRKRIILPVIGPGGGIRRWPEASQTQGGGAGANEIDVPVARRRQPTDDRIQRATATDRSDAPSDDQDGAR